MDKEIEQSIAKLKKIEHELGISNEESGSSEIPENTFDYTERLLFTSIQEIKEVQA